MFIVLHLIQHSFLNNQISPGSTNQEKKSSSFYVDTSKKGVISGN